MSLLLLAGVTAGVYAARDGDRRPAEPGGTAPRQAPKGFPDASDTGVPPGTRLTAVDGDVTLDTPGEVYSDRLVRGCISVTAPDVTIKRVKVVCEGMGAISSLSTGLLVEDTEIDLGGVPGRTGIGAFDFTARRVNVHGGENLIWAERDVVVEDSFIHDPVDYDPATDPHTDGIQLPSGASDIRISRNTIDGNYAGRRSFGNSAITTGSRMADVVIEHNKLAGGGYTLRCADAAGSTGFTVTGNRFSTALARSVGGYGPTDGGCSRAATRYRDNVYADGPRAGHPVGG